MSTVTLSSRQWSRIYAFLCSRPDVYVDDEAQCRRFITAVLWVTQSGAQWRLLPAAYGKWNSVYRRFARWMERGYLGTEASAH
ncbi:MAG: transposase [Chloroflexota bacterium]|nr:transposase [Chloroflexota bacterium]